MSNNKFDLIKLNLGISIRLVELCYHCVGVIHLNYREGKNELQMSSLYKAIVNSPKLLRRSGNTREETGMNKKSNTDNWKTM